MTSADIANIRLVSQQISASEHRSPKELVAWMGAIQAQDYGMAKWAVGLRLPGTTEQLIEAALNDGDIIRTHLMRPTWHMVSSDDIYWLLELTGPRIKASMRSRQVQLELDNRVIRKSNDIIVKTIAVNGFSTREQIVESFIRAGFSLADNRAAHLLMNAEIDGLICSGRIVRNKPTYALLSERVPVKNTLAREEALARLTKRYFYSHGPATLQDFVWWSGLTVRDASRGLTMIGQELVGIDMDSQKYWMSPVSAVPPVKDTVYLLPAYDEFIISYRDRSAALTPGTQLKAIMNNGMFRPVIVVNGRVVGTWRRTLKKDKIIFEPDYFNTLSEAIRKKILKKAVEYSKFVGKQIEWGI